VPGLQTMLTQAHNALEPQPVTFQSLPQDLKQDWVTPAGAYRIQVSPKGNANDNEVLKKFTAAVRKIAPNATGTPISIQEAGRHDRARVRRGGRAVVHRHRVHCSPSRCEAYSTSR
jgi:hypothetical protein